MLRLPYLPNLLTLKIQANHLYIFLLFLGTDEETPNVFRKKIIVQVHEQNHMHIHKILTFAEKNLLFKRLLVSHFILHINTKNT